MANWSDCSSTTPQIPSATSGTSGGEQQNYVSFVHDHQYLYESFGHPFPGFVGAEMMKLWSRSAYDCGAENGVGGYDANINNQVETRRKTRLSSEQVDALEKSFQEEIELEQQSGATLDERKNKVKLEPDRKMKLSRELGLHPRQVAIWFQNRRARLKGKKIEELYNVLKQDFEIVSKENQSLKEEVMKLKSKLDDRESMRASRRYIAQVWLHDKVVADSTNTGISAAIQSINEVRQGRTNNPNDIPGSSGYLFGEDYSSTMLLPYWDVPNCYPSSQ
ncbi:putative homeobox-leucine zipper protein ATHB-51 [Papaver somniferum]|uniref:putative homeobox-leucine zipper protein ATHB-51 n=1 Tax=Papaver somniferum TaxID=3469 RepID=UPI000E6FB9B0|nr:putative homeobox-leucine zipper protein ATHB-51 [Papaver somniferum]